jgi:transmembrane sensor
MPLSHFQRAELIAKFLQNKTSPKEELLLNEHLQQNEKDRELLASFKNTQAVKEELDYINEIDVRQAWKQVKAKRNDHRIQPMFRWLAGAAAIAGIALILLWPKTPAHDPGIIADSSGKYKNDILPGSNKAQLQLSNGEVVELTDNIDSLLEKNGTKIIGKSGELNYTTASGQPSPEILYNTLRVPKAGTYRIILPDGSKVWMNALSELRYPIQFAGHERRVKLKGEAYFEINKDFKRPFKVDVDEASVEVLGTHFNVSAYDVNMTTTLLEGRVKVNYKQHESILKPGQEAFIAENALNIQQADLDKAIAWKENIFYFKEDGIENIMEQMARWYDLEIIYEGKIPAATFSGSINRNAKLSEVLELLSFTSGYKFDIVERKLKVIFIHEPS